MRRPLLALAALVLAGVALTAQSSPRERALFDGKTTNGWRSFKKSTFPDHGWIVQDGWLKKLAKGNNPNGGGDIITVDAFDNFDLQFEWKVMEGANSGVKDLV